MDYLQGLPLSTRSHRQEPHSCFLCLNVQEKQLSCHHAKACKAAFLHFHLKDVPCGQQQRVLLTRALCATRKILLLDEPVSGLDPVATADMYQIINELNKEDHELMEKTRITDLADRCYRQLSGGQQQRVLLTRALCATRKILLLDEPVSGLDPVATADMYQIINELNKEDRVTIIMISHDIGEVATYASHVLHIGQKVFFGTKEEYLESKIGKRLVDAGEEGKA